MAVNPDKIPDHFRGIGMVADCWAHFELHVSYMIWKLMDVEKRAGACATTNIGSIGMKLRTLISLAELRGASDSSLKVFNVFFGHAEGLSRQRNRVVHDAWGEDIFNGSMKFTITVDRKLTFDYESYTFDQMVDLGDKIIIKTDELNDIMETIMSEISATFSPERFEQSRGIRIGRL